MNKNILHCHSGLDPESSGTFFTKSILYFKNYFSYKEIVRLIFLPFAALCTLNAYSTQIDLNIDMLRKTSRRSKVETYEGFADESFGFHVTISTNESSPKDVQISGIENFQTISQSTSTSFELAGSRQSTSYIYHFELMPIKAETLTLGPVMATCDGKTFQSKKIKIIITPPSKTKNSKGKKAANQICFAELEFSNPLPFVWEASLMTMRIYAQEQKVLDVQTEIPEISGFEIKKLSSSQKRMAIERTPYAVIENNFLITPTKPGNFSVGQFPIHYRANTGTNHHRHDAFFGSIFGQLMNSRDAVVRSASTTINVQPIPNAPHAVDGIGSFSSFELSLEKTKCSAGEPVVLTLILEGNGNFAQITAPELTLPAGFKAYDSKTDFKEINNKQALQGGIKTFEYILQAN
ncbi:BatD family protein, partial [Candidatus Babeliales bacterium]|nr:BatD family protein [Candidatus Babeliales bacterium]